MFEFYCLRKNGECSWISADLRSENLICTGLTEPISLIVLENERFCTCNYKGIVLEWKRNGELKRKIDTKIQNVSCFHCNEEQFVIGVKKKIEIWNWIKCLWKTSPLGSDFLEIHKSFFQNCILQGKNCLLCTTTKGSLKIYDIKKSKKPIFEIKISGKALQKIVPTDEETTIYVIQNQHMHKIGLGETKSVLKTLKGSLGSIRDVVFFEKKVIEVGADRYLRVHNPNFRKKTIEREVFLRQRLTNVLVKKSVEKETISYFPTLLPM